MITNCECRPGEPKEYCQLRETMCKIEAVMGHTIELQEQAVKIGLHEYSILRPHDFEGKIDETKKRIMEHVAAREIHKISGNIDLKEENLANSLKLDIEQMDFIQLLKSVGDKYGGSDEIVFDQLLEKAQHLRPYNKEIKIQSNKLILEGSDQANITAFEKLTSVIIDGIRPSEAVESKRIVDIKPYVNRRLDVKFDKLENAIKMSKVLRLL